MGATVLPFYAQLYAQRCPHWLPDNITVMIIVLEEAMAILTLWSPCKFSVSCHIYGHEISLFKHSRDEFLPYPRSHPRISGSQLYVLAVIRHCFADHRFDAHALGVRLGLNDAAIRARLRRLAALGLVKRHSLSNPIFSTRHPKYAGALWRLTAKASELLDHYEIQVEEVPHESHQD